MGIGAKDSSNHLIAGFLRSFPKDSHGDFFKKKKRVGGGRAMGRGVGEFNAPYPISKLRIPSIK